MPSKKTKAPASAPVAPVSCTTDHQMFTPEMMTKAHIIALPLYSQMIAPGDHVGHSLELGICVKTTCHAGCITPTFKVTFSCVRKEDGSYDISSFFNPNDPFMNMEN